MRRAWGAALAVCLGLVGCEVPQGVTPVSGNPGSEPGPAASMPGERKAELAGILRDFLASQQARQQVNVTSSTLLSNNIGTLLSNNGAALTRNAPLISNGGASLISNGGASLISNGGSSYRVAASLPMLPSLSLPMPDGSYFYRFSETAVVESFVTRKPNAATERFEVPDADVIMHARMTMSLNGSVGDDLFNQVVTNSYRIEVLKSPVFTDYVSDVSITAPLLGQTTSYVEAATYQVGEVPVVAEATHSAFTRFTVDGKAMDLPTSGEERIAIGASVFTLSYQNLNGAGVGSGSWTAPQREAWPLTYRFDFLENLAQVRVTLPESRVLALAIRPGMRVEAGEIRDQDEKALATLVKRDDGKVVVRFEDGTETLLFE